MKKVILLFALSTLSVMTFGQFKIKQPISNEPETDLQREVLWGVMTENLRNEVYELQLLCRILKPNGHVLVEKMVYYSTSSAKKYKFTSATTWKKICEEDAEWSDTTYIPEYKFFFNLMNNTVKPMTDTQLKKAIITNLDAIDKLFDK